MEVLLLNKTNKKININSGIKNYSVFFEDNLSKIFSKIPKDSIFLVDQKLEEKLNKYNRKFKSKTLYLIASENNKSFENLGVIIKKLLNLNIRRSTTIISIGGGTIQDLSAFIASIIFRGINWIFIPTTLLSQCDSCIGGKSSINIFGMKNQLGNFYPPSKIYICFNFLYEISKKEIISGLGEMSHFYFLSSVKDYKFFDKMILKALKRDKYVMKKIIYKSLMIKKRFIETDEFDKKERLILNYGHSFGHAIEKITKFKVPHGIAVANGIKIANYISFKMKYLKESDFILMNNTLNKILKGIKLYKIRTGNLIEALKKDKKNTRTNIRIVLTKGQGRMFLKKNINIKNLENILNDYKKNYLN